MSALPCVVIPTFCRPDGLARAVRSAFAQTGVDAFNVLVVDNDPAASARDISQTLQNEAPASISFRYVHEPAAGVANARNRAMTETDSRLILFLDDDQSAPKNWLANLLTNHARFPAAVTFGPVETCLPDSVTSHTAYLKDFFARQYDRPSGYIDVSFGCGNALLDRSLLPPLKTFFDAAMNESGGEDDVLFEKVRASGGHFAWCAEAPAFEHVPESRAHLGYTLKRAFSYGQGPITLARKETPPRWDKVGFWMIVGLFKAIANSLAYLVLWLVRAPNRARYLDLAARGIGKVFWWRSIGFYGAARLKQGRARTA